MKRGWVVLIRVLAGLLAVYFIAYTILVTPRRFLQCLDGPIATYRRDPQDGLGADLPSPIDGNEVALQVNGDEILPAMLELIDGAEHSIRWQVMVFKPDEAGQQLAEALSEAAGRGVTVQLAFSFDQSTNAVFFAPSAPEVTQRYREAMPVMLAEMRAAGVTVLDSGEITGTPSPAALSEEARRWQREIMRSACIGQNHVDHRKVLIVDDEVALVGGMNVGNEYLYWVPPDVSMDASAEAAMREEAGEAEAWEKWQDSAVLVSGPVVRQLVEAFNPRWEVMGGEPVSPITPSARTRGDAPIRAVSQGPGRAEISTGMVALMDAAEEEIYAAFPYVSHPVLLDHLMAASERGVRVVFVYPGDHNEVAISRRLLRLLSGELMAAGVELYEHNERMNHTKLMVVDGRTVSVGSHNFNYRSVRHDLELNLLIEDEALAEEAIRRVFEPYMEQAERLTVPYDLRWGPFDRLVLPFS